MLRLRYLSLLVVTIIVAVAGGTYRAASTVPEFYEESLALPPQEAHAAGDEFTATSFSLANQVREAGAWSAVFTDEQVNGWLAVDLPKKHPELLDPQFEEPRIRFHQDGLQLGVRRRVGAIKTVLWLDVEVKMSGAQEAALRFRHARAGSLPLPLGNLLDSLTEVAKDLDLPLRWTTVDGDPTAIIGLPALGEDGLRYELDKLKVSDGRLFVSGRTQHLAGVPTAAAAR
jgi:hypothetical protein